ncbi:L-lactate permease [Trujillonella humicola]|uniref:L-lactate permease n=1 Tax=Trujillonella humicola TaxID=3383699 RepID=UPI0039069750
MEDLPVDVLHWALALSPIVVLLVLLAVLRWSAPQAAAVGMFYAAAVALIFFQTPFDTVVVAVAKGIWDAVPILYVVFPALLLYHVGKASGAFDALRRGISRYSKNDVFIVLAFGWVFASFMQGIAGFGAPIAVVAPLLVAIGVRPIYAVLIPLIGHAWANMFGTLAVGWLATLQVVDVENETATAVETAILLWIPNILGAFYIAWLVGKWQAVRLATPMVLIISLIHGGGQLALMPVSPVLSTFVAASVAMVALFPLARWSRYSEPAELDERPAMKEDADLTAEEEGEPTMSLLQAAAPYGALTAVAIGLLVIGPVEDFLSRLAVGLPFPEVTTGYGVENEAEQAYQEFEPLVHPGTFLLFAVAVAWLLYRRIGAFSRKAEVASGEAGAGEEAEEEPGVWRGTAEDAVPAAFAVVGFLVLSSLLDHSGQTDVLAQGISDVAPAPVYAFLSVFIGVIGAFMTSSNTASNVLFADLQDTVAGAEGLRQSSILAAQSTGGAIGNAIAPANIVLGTSTTGAQGKEGEVLRKALPWAAVATALTGIVTVFLA